MCEDVSAEKRRILDMLVEGKIKAGEALELLDALETPAAENQEKRFLRVLVDGEENKVRVRVPFRLISAGFNIMKFMPKDAEKALADKVDLSGIDFSKVDAEFLDALSELEVTVEGETNVRIWCE